MAMIWPCLALFFLSDPIFRTRFNLGIGLAALIVIGMALSRGFYWHIFDRGHGFYTVNRLSALAVFLLILFSAHINSAIRTRFKRRSDWQGTASMGLTPEQHQQDADVIRAYLDEPNSRR